jgi:hypothetical protein
MSFDTRAAKFFWASERGVHSSVVTPTALTVPIQRRSRLKSQRGSSPPRRPSFFLLLWIRISRASEALRPFSIQKWVVVFDHLNNRSGFGIDPSDGRSGAKRSIQPSFASLPNFFRAFIPVDRLANPKRLTARPAEHLRGSRHTILTSSAICWFRRIASQAETEARPLRWLYGSRKAGPKLSQCVVRGAEAWATPWSLFKKRDRCLGLGSSLSYAEPSCFGIGSRESIFFLVR